MKALELFAGIGGIALAEHMAGIEVVGLCEFAEFPQRVLRKNFPDVPIFADVKKLNASELEKEGVNPGTIDIISGGFPCQPFSVAGRRKGTADDRDLWPEMFRVIKEVRPTWIVGENVANFANMELDRTLFDLESGGYEAQSFIIPACAVAAPHQRLRTFVVAHANGHRQLQSQRIVQDVRRRVGNSSAVLVNTGSQRWQARHNNEHRDVTQRESQRQLSPTNGTPAVWQPEPQLGRVADGISCRMDRLTGLGNAVVPQQILPIFQAIVSIENGVKS